MTQVHHLKIFISAKNRRRRRDRDFPAACINMLKTSAAFLALTGHFGALEGILTDENRRKSFWTQQRRRRAVLQAHNAQIDVDHRREKCGTNNERCDLHDVCIPRISASSTPSDGFENQEGHNSTVSGVMSCSFGAIASTHSHHCFVTPARILCATNATA